MSPANHPPQDRLPPLPFALPADPAGRDAAAPLAGLTVLVVEDSRFASDALRLMIQRLGGRMRRAETIAAARAHVRTYKPDVVIVDLGLPDGPGQALIRDLANGARPPGVILGLSGDPEGRGPALAAGAAGFIEKPLGGLAGFAGAILRHLPGGAAMTGAPDLGGPAGSLPPPDPLALHDDLLRAAAILRGGSAATAVEEGYVTGFLRGLGKVAGDSPLAEAARYRDPALRQMVLDRLRGLPLTETFSPPA
jgi:CheY-like chemotaxis protein